MGLLLVPGGLRGVGAAAKRKVLGVAFIAVVVGLLAFSVLIYNKALPWQSSATLTLRAERIGNQLTPPADVKVRGVEVGRVSAVSTDGTGTTLTLKIDKDKLDKIPENVLARILPKTLFGEKFVDLVVPPSGAAAGHLQDGDVIPQDRSKTAIEMGKVFDDLLPLLRTLQPQKLNETLSALATALQDRGQKLGENFVLTDHYFSALNPHLPTIEADISGLADLADSLDAAAPDLLRTLANTAFTQRTIAEKADPLADFLKGTTGFADTATRVLTRNENNLIQLAAVSRPILGVLATYSPEYPCLLRGLTDIERRVEGTFIRPGTSPGLKLHLEVVSSRGAYIPGKDTPSYNNYGKPSCQGLPQPGAAANYPHPGVAANKIVEGPGTLAPSAYTGSYGDIGPIGSVGEQSLVSSIAAPLLGQSPSEVPQGLADLLFAPMLRGMAVSYQ